MELADTERSEQAPTDRDVTSRETLELEATAVFTPQGTVRSPSLHDIGGFKLGDIVGERYVITEKMGQGGCGFVYAAHDRQLDVAVALKTLRPDVHLSEDAVSELKSEILMARKVTHANVCRIFDFGVHHGDKGLVCFMTMELIRGETLAERIARDGRVDLDVLAPIAEQVLSALDAAHEAGVVHADLKPANIMLKDSSEGIRALVTDFGLATAHTSDIEDDSKPTFGTPAYMAPEQVEGKALTPAADYYSLGCTLFHALSGKYPFLAGSAFETAIARLEGEVPRLDKVSDVTGKWADIVAGLMSRDEEQRPSSSDIRATLDTAPRRRRIQFVVAVGIAAVLAAGGAVGLTWSAPAPDRLALSEPDSPKALELLVKGERIINQRAATAAIADLEAAHEIAGDHPRILSRLAEVKSKDREVAIALAALAVERAEKGSDEREFYRSVLLRMQGENVEATDVLTRLAGKYPKDVEIHSDLIDLQLGQELVDLARETVAGLEAKTSVEEIQLRHARLEVEIKSQNYEAAKQQARAAVEFGAANGFPIAAARAKAHEASTYRQLGDHEHAKVLAEEAVLEAERLDRPEIWHLANRVLMPIAMSSHDFERARQLVDRERELYREADNELARDHAGIALAELLAVSGDTAGALAMLTSILPRLRQAESNYWTAFALGQRSVIRGMRAEPSRAADDCEASETIFRAVKSRRLTAWALAICTYAYLEAGRLDEARAAGAASMKIRTARKLDFLVAQNKLALAEVAMARGRHEVGESLATQALDYFSSTDLVNDEVTALIILSRFAAVRGDLDAANKQIMRARQRRIGSSWELGIQLDTTAAYVDAKLGRTSAIAQLDKIIAKAEKGGYHHLAMQGQMALASALAATGDADRAELIKKRALARAKVAGVVLFRF